MRLKPTSALLVLALACAPGLARADYAAGLQAYDSGDFTTAYMEWLPLAKQGDSKAQHGLALLYETGRGVPVKDDAEAAKWYAAAALQGVAESQANLALMFAEGRGVKSFELLLAPGQLGKDLAVEVVWKGRAVKKKVVPDPTVLLREFAERLDRTFLPVAKVAVP